MPDQETITIVQMNDSHGYIDLHSELFWAGDHAEYRPAGGYARIASVLDQIRQSNPGRVTALDCGDTIHGTYPAVQTQGEALVSLLNRLGFDAMTAHWEFAYGPQHLQRVAGQLEYPLLAINCYDQDSGELVFPPYTVLELGGVRLGVIGIAATIVDKVMPASFSRGVCFTLGNEELPGYIDQLRNRENVDLIVVISHLGYPQEVKLAKQVDGIDVLLSSHTHNRLFAPARVNNTLLIQSGCHGSFLGRLDLDVRNGRIESYAHELIPILEEIPPDLEMQASVSDVLGPQRAELERVVGHTVTALHRNTVLEAPMDNLLLQSLLDLSGAQVAFSNGWRYGAPVPPGPVTLNDLWNIIPVNPPVSVCNLTGDEIWTMMEENLEHTFARDPYNQMGGYVKRCMGLNMYIKVENDAGRRIQELFIGGERLRPDRVYRAVYVTSQGVPAKYGADREALDVRAIDALQRYLEKHRPVEAGNHNSVVAI